MNLSVLCVFGKMSRGLKYRDGIWKSKWKAKGRKAAAVVYRDCNA